MGIGSNARASSTRFAAGERADTLVHQALSMHARQARLHLLAQRLSRAQKGGAAADTAGEKIEHRDGVRRVKGGALRHVADAKLCLLAVGGMEGDFAFVCPLPENGADKRRFSRAVRTDQRNDLPAVHMQVDIVENHVGSDFHRQVFNFEAAGIFAAAGSCVSVDHPSASFTMSMFCRMAAK